MARSFGTVEGYDFPGEVRARSARSHACRSGRDGISPASVLQRRPARPQALGYTGIINRKKVGPD